MRRLIVLGFSLIAFSALAQTAPVPAPASTAADPAVRTLDHVEVSVKSPPMWRLTKGDRQILVLGTQYPLPQTMPFFPRTIQREVAAAQAVVRAPGVYADDNVSIFRGLMLWNSVRKAKQNEGGKSLQQVLPAPLYAQWATVRDRYLPGRRDVESMRPMYAAYELYKEAVERVQVRPDDPVMDVVGATAKASGVPIIDSRVIIPVAATKATARAFDVPVAPDIQCLQMAVERVDPFVGQMSDAANAWSVGDMPAYRAAIARYEPLPACWARLTNEAFARMAGINDPYGRVDATWLATLHKTLQTHSRVFTMLPARDMVRGTGLAQALAAEGWTATPLFKE